MIKTKDIFINGERSMYTINTEGEVYSKISQKFLKPFMNPQGYYLVDLHHNKESHTYQLHRLVAITFIPNPEMLPTVNHKNGDKSDNSVRNLEWMTRLDNVRHAWRTGLAKPRYGTANPANVYTEEQIHEVCALLELDQLGNNEIAEKCCVNVTLIRDIKFRGKWKQISELYQIPKERKTYRFIHLNTKIYTMMRNGLRNRDILNKLCGKDDKDRYSLKRYIERCRWKYSHSLNDYPSNGSTPTS